MYPGLWSRGPLWSLLLKLKEKILWIAWSGQTCNFCPLLFYRINTTAIYLCYYTTNYLLCQKTNDLRKLVRTLSAHSDTNLPNCREFSNERTRVERRETFRKLRMKENFSKAFEGYFQWIIRAGEISNKNKQLVGGAWLKKPCPYRPYLPSPLLHIAYGSRPVVFILLYIYLRNQYFHLLDLLLFSPFRTIHHYYWLLATFFVKKSLCLALELVTSAHSRRGFFVLYEKLLPFDINAFLANLISSFPFGYMLSFFIWNKYELPFVLGFRLKKLKMPNSIDFKGIFFHIL